MNQKAVVVFSGGQDSTTCLFWALEQFDEIVLVSFDYGQRNISELACAKRIAEEWNLEHHVLDMQLLNQLAPNAMTRKEIAIETKGEGEPPTTFVEGRNMLFLTFAAIFAKVNHARHIVTGVCQTDFSGYPDCRDVFVKSLNTTLDLAMDFDFEIHTPLMWLNKAEEWELSDRLGKLDYIKEKTLTCYNNIVGNGCGECPSCVLRRKGYEAYMEKKGATNENGR